MRALFLVVAIAFVSEGIAASLVDGGQVHSTKRCRQVYKKANVALPEPCEQHFDYYDKIQIEVNKMGMNSPNDRSRENKKKYKSGEDLQYMTVRAWKRNRSGQMEEVSLERHFPEKIFISAGSADRAADLDVLDHVLKAKGLNAKGLKYRKKAQLVDDWKKRNPVAYQKIWNGYETRAGDHKLNGRHPKITAAHCVGQGYSYSAPMKYALFFDGGRAIHAKTDVKHIGTPGSHGCVGLSEKNARTLYCLMRQRQSVAGSRENFQNTVVTVNEHGWLTHVQASSSSKSQPSWGGLGDLFSGFPSSSPKPNPPTAPAARESNWAESVFEAQ